MEKKMIKIKSSDGSFMDVELVTYLFDENQQNNYVVYSKGEVKSAEGDEVIYISKIINNNGVLSVTEIVDDNEWLNVQNMLKRIANA